MRIYIKKYQTQIRFILCVRCVRGRSYERTFSIYNYPSCKNTNAFLCSQTNVGHFIRVLAIRASRYMFTVLFSTVVLVVTEANQLFDLTTQSSTFRLHSNSVSYMVS